MRRREVAFLLCRLLTAGGAAVAVGCSRSPATQFFTLVPVRPDAPNRPFTGGPVQLSVVHIPAVLDRPQRVIQSSQQRLVVLEQQRWGAPLNDLVQRVLSEDLAARLPPGMVLTANAPVAADTRKIVIDVQEFQPEPNGRVVLDASWALLDGEQPGRPLARAAQRFEYSGGSSADSQVAAMSQLLGQLADAIVGSLLASA